MKRINHLALIMATLMMLTSCSSSSNSSSADTGLDIDYVTPEGYSQSSASESESDGWFDWLRNKLTADKEQSRASAEESGGASTPDSVGDIYRTDAAEEDESEDTTRLERDPRLQRPQEDGETASVSEESSESSQSSESSSPDSSEDPSKPKEPKPDTRTVTMHIRCDTAVINGMHKETKWAGIVPASRIILDTTKFEIEEGDTVLDVLIKARDKYKIHMQYSGSQSSAYVEGINNLYEFDGGRWSGWMYCVNSWYPNYGCGVYVLEPGDSIEWNYTCDLGKDLGQGWLGDGWVEAHK